MDVAEKVNALRARIDRSGHLRQADLTREVTRAFPRRVIDTVALTPIPTQTVVTRRGPKTVADRSVITRYGAGPAGAIGPPVGEWRTNGACWAALPRGPPQAAVSTARPAARPAAVSIARPAARPVARPVVTTSSQIRVPTRVRPGTRYDHMAQRAAALAVRTDTAIWPRDGSRTCDRVRAAAGLTAAPVTHGIIARWTAVDGQMHGRATLEDDGIVFTDETYSGGRLTTARYVLGDGATLTGPIVGGEPHGVWTVDGAPAFRCDAGIVVERLPAAPTDARNDIVKL